MLRDKKSKRFVGIVKNFDPKKGQGYVITDNGQYVFIHFSSLPIKDGHFIPLKENQKISFLIKEGNLGPQAYDIKVL